MLKKVKRVFVKFLILVVGPYILPNFMVFYFVCGAYDFSRNSPFSWRLMNNYCFSRGTFLWAMSPLNILLDLLTLPFLNKKVYRLEDFPQDYQREIKEVIDYNIYLEGRSFNLNCCNIGNPHCVILEKDIITQELSKKYGPLLEKNPIFRQTPKHVQARACGAYRRVVFAKKMLKNTEIKFSSVMGVSEWIPQDVQLLALDWLRSEGYGITC